jgi:hypothetical protein
MRMRMMRRFVVDVDIKNYASSQANHASVLSPSNNTIPLLTSPFPHPSFHQRIRSRHHSTLEHLNISKSDLGSILYS